MAYEIVLNESSASLRCVPMILVGSNGTTPSTGESGNTFHFEIGGFHYGSGGSLSVVSAAAGMYVAAFAASKLSVVGPGAVYYQSATAIPSASPFRVVRVNSYNSQDMGLAAFSEVSIHAGTHSNVTFKGIQNYANISNVTLHAGTHSGVTIQGLSRIESSVTIANATYSAVTVRHEAGDFGSITTFGVSKIAAASYSGVTVGIDNIKADSYSGVTVGIDNIGRTSMQSVADRVLLRDLATNADSATRNVQNALRTLRNQVVVGSSIMTVYTEDDSTSAWTASISTDANAAPLTGFNPAGGSA